MPQLSLDAELRGPVLHSGSAPVASTDIYLLMYDSHVCLFWVHYIDRWLMMVVQEALMLL